MTMDAAPGASDLTDLDDLDPDDLADLAMRLLEIASPPGDEARMAAAIADALRRRGVEHVELDETFPNSPSVIARIDGGGVGPTLQWHGHLDAIATAHLPATRTGDQLTGRGASDMKGALAAMIVAAGVIAQQQLLPRGSLLLTFHGLHEEGGNTPLLDLIERGIYGDAVIIGELGNDDVLVTSSPGLTFWEIDVATNRPAVHETLRDRDVHDAMDACMAIMQALGDYAASLQGPSGSLHAESIYVGSLTAGDYHNRVPSTGTIKGTLRHLDGTDLATVHAELADVVAQATPAGVNAAVNAHGLAEAYSISPDVPIARALRAAVAEVTGRRMRQRASTAVGNAHHFVHLAGIPAVYYGCDYATAHSDHETVSISEMARLARIYIAATQQFVTDQTADAPELADSCRPSIPGNRRSTP